MPHVEVQFVYHTGLTRPLFRNARLAGTWDSEGRFSNQRSETPMTEIRDETGCPAFAATVSLDTIQTGWQFHWGVLADTPLTPNRWIIATEVADANSAARDRTFTLQASGQEEHYWLTTGRR